MLTHERLLHVVTYYPDTGIFVWRVQRRKAPVGKTIGSKDYARGYWTARIDYKRYYLHRLAWFYMTGEWPKDEIDHINQNKSDNRWCNLREATTKQNLENGPKRKNNTSGAIGVTWHNRDKLWCARIVHNRKKITLGYFKEFDDAVKARNDGVRKYFTHAPACTLPPACPDDPASRDSAA